MNAGFCYSDTVGRDGDGAPLVRFYAARYAHSSVDVWRRRAESGEISLNGTIASPVAVLRAGDRLEWMRPPWQEPEVPTDWYVVYEDEHLLAVDKPAGLPCVPNGGFLENTLSALVARARPGVKTSPAHRLGRGTSGIVLFSKTDLARRALASLFRDETARSGGMLQKRYIARTWPRPGARPGERFEVDAPIGRIPHTTLGSVWGASPSGKPAKSICTVRAAGSDAVIWDVELITGRPHQIRIHLASIGSPLLGDPLYLPGGAPRGDALPGDCGYFLRAVSLGLPHPATGELLTLAVPPFRCLRCGSCCKIPGGIVRLRDGETAALAAAAGMDESAFIDRHTAIAPDRRCLVLLDAPDGACEWLTPEGGCRVHSAKPAQCREFPHSWRNSDSAKTCPALALCEVGQFD